MAKIFKAIVVGALVSFGIALLLPFIGAASPFIGLFGISNAIIAVLVGGGITGGLSALLAPSMDLSTTRNRPRTTVDANATMKWIFGETALATDIIFAASHGAKNQFYSYIIAGAAHEIDSYGSLYINDEIVTFTGDAATGNWAGVLWRQTNLGTDVQTAFIDIDADDNFAPGLWPATADGLGMAHYRLRWAINKDKISSGVPTRVTQVVKGGPVYDPRLDSTRGGTGLHRADDQSTWEYNDGTDDIGANWALVVLRYLIGWKINGKLVIGVGIDPDDIDMDQAIAAANVCEASIDGKPRYRVGGILPVTNDHPSIISQLEGAINGKVALVGGKYYIWAPNDDLTPFSTIDESDLIRDVGVNFTPSGPMEKLYNTARGSFVSGSATDLFNLVPYPEVTESAAVTEDGGVRILNHDLAMVQDVSIAERVVRGMVRRSRFGATWRFALGPKGLTFQVFTVTTLNIQETNNVNVTVRIIDMSYSISGAVVLEVIEEDSSIYDTSAALGTPVTQLDPAGFDPRTKIPVTGLASLDITVRGDQGTATDGLKVTWDDPGPWVVETQVQYKVASETDFQSVPAHRVDVQTAIILPVEQNTLYDIKARHITRFGVVGDFVAITDTTGDDFTGGGTTVGFTSNFAYDDLDTTQLAAGASRYAMLSDSGDDTSGSQNNFHLTQAILLNKVDDDAFLRSIFYDGVRPSDAIIFFISTTRWFHFKITQIGTIVGTGTATAYKFNVTLIEHVDGDPTANQPSTAGNLVEFQFSQPLDNAFNLLIDPDFDLSTGFLVNDSFWDEFIKDTGPGTVDSVITFQAGLGANGSNAVDMRRGNHDFSQVQLIAYRKHRTNFGSFEFRIRYKTTNAAEGNIDFFTVFAQGYTNVEDTTVNSSIDKTVDLTPSLNVWKTARIVVDVPANDTSQYWRFGVSFTANFAPATDNLRIDSIFVYGVPDAFGNEVIDTLVITGLVPEADTVADANKVLQADGTWVANAGGGDVTAVPTPVDNQLAIWTSATAIEGHPDLLWTGTALQVRNATSYAEFDHDGTDFNTTFVNTTDWNITGLTNIRIGAGIDLQFLDNDNIFMGTTQQGQLRWNSGLGAFVMNTGVGNLIQLSIAANEYILLSDTPDVIKLNQTVNVEQTISQLERLTAPGDTVTRGQWWVRDDAPGQSPMFTDDAGVDIDLSATGGGGDMLLGTVQDITAAKEYQDNIELRFGDSADVLIDFTSVDFVIQVVNTTADFRLILGGENAIIANADAAIDLYFNSSLKFSTNINGIFVTDSVYIAQQALANSNIANAGQFWVRNDASQTPMFTDDLGADSELNAGGVGDMLLGTVQSITAAKEFNDSIELRFGSDNDARMYFNNAISTLFLDLNDNKDFVIRGGTGGTENLISLKDNGPIELYFNGALEFRTQDHNATDNITGAEVQHFDGTFYDVGLARMPKVNFTANTTISDTHWHKRLVHNGTIDASRNLTFNTETSQPQDVVLWVLAKNGPVVLVDGTMVLHLYDGGGAVPPTGNITIARGGWATVVKDADSAAHVTGVGLSS